MTVLVVDDEVDQRQYLAEVISEWGHVVSQAADGKEALEFLSTSQVDVLVTDLMMPRMDGFELLRTLGAEDRMPPSIVMTAFGSIEKAIATIHDLGGFWFLEKPIDTAGLKVLLARAGAQSRLSKENEQLRRQLASKGALGDMVGRSAPMIQIFDLIRQVAPTKASVLITGESGTGKELVARALHDNSRRSQGPYVALNCAAMPETLIESELFGHEKGAFTGAVERRIGALESAAGGTVFLDEIAEMPLPMQAKLLRVLEDFRFRRLGSRLELTADVRIIAATNRDPLKAIQEGKFREDLYYRLNVFHIEIPPLRDRKDDIPLIVEAMIHNLNRKHDTRVTDASPEFLAALQEQNWEGNVRELRNMIERAVILAGSGTIRPSHVPYGIRTLSVIEPAAEPLAPAPPEPGTINLRLGTTIDEAERVLIEATLILAGMNKTRAASILGITAKTLHTKLRQYQLGSNDVAAEEDTGGADCAIGSLKAGDMTPEVTSRFAHDLRTGLRTVVTRIQLVQSSGALLLPGEDQSLLQEAVAAARDMDGLLGAMVAYQEGKGEDGVVSLRLLLRGLPIERRALLVEAGAELAVVNEVGDGEDLRVPAALKTVLKELLTNACRFRSIERPLRIVIASRIVPASDPEAVEVAVTDNGNGVDPAYLEKIFAPFFRLHSREEFPGYGLGLATCRRIVADWGGSLVAEGATDHGLTVRIKVPVSR